MIKFHKFSLLLQREAKSWIEIMSHNKWGVLVAIFFLFYLFFGSIIHFNFAQDDFTILYYVQNNTLLFYPYYVASLIFTPLYYVFKLNASHYYIVSFLLYICVGLSLYYFSLVLFKSRIIAFAAVVFFVTSFAGSDALYTMNVGILMSLFLILELWTLSFYTMYLTAKKVKHFYFAFFLYTLTLFLFPYRAYVLLLFVLSLYFFIRQKRPTALFVKQLFLLILPYIFVYGLLPNIPLLQPTEHHLPPLFAHIKPESIESVVQTVRNAFIPNTLSFVGNYIEKIDKNYVANIYLILLLTILVIYKNRRIVLLFFFLLIPILGFVLIFGEHYKTFDRYLYVIRPFLALFLAALLFHKDSQALGWLFAKGNKSTSFQLTIRRFLIIIFVFPIFFSHTIENLNYQKGIITDRTYSRHLFSTVLSSHPNIQDYTIFFFNSPDVPTRNLLSRVTDVGTFPHSGSFAVYYKKNYEKIEVVFNCDTLLTALKKWRNKKIEIYYFFDSGNSLKLLSKTRLNEKCLF